MEGEINWPTTRPPPGKTKVFFREIKNRLSVSGNNIGCSKIPPFAQGTRLVLLPILLSRKIFSLRLF
jgi:hypothetical protein